VAEVKPFRGLRYAPERAGSLSHLVCPPYDVIAPEEAARLRTASKYNAVHLELPEGSADEADPSSRYQRAARTLQAWRVAGVLVQEARPALYLVQEDFTWDGRPRCRRGVLAAVRLADWSERVVLPHERTLSGPKADRLALLRASAANLSPVFLLHRSRPPAEDALWQAIDEAEPLGEAGLDDGHTTRVWALSDGAQAWQAALANEPLYVADGHHRYETALRYRDERRMTGSADADAPYEYVLSYLVSMADPGLLVLPTHRCLPPGALDRAALERFETERRPVAPGDEAALSATLDELARRGKAGSAYALYLPGEVLLLAPRADAARWLPAERDAAWRALDVAQVEALLLQPLLGPEAPEQLTYTRSASEAARLVDQGAAAAAVLLNPTPPPQIAAVADAGERMPQKSTYFYPKPPTGLVFHLLGEAHAG
jgi:uncharacterized protein (DUF1015 family)